MFWAWGGRLHQGSFPRPLEYGLALIAVEAVAAIRRPGQGDVVACRDSSYPRSYGLDHACAFVTYDSGQHTGLVTVHGLPVSVAQAGGECSSAFA